MGGQELYSLRSCPSSYPKRQAGRAVRGFLYVVAKADVLRVYAVNPSGGVVDSFRIRP